MRPEWLMRICAFFIRIFDAPELRLDSQAPTHESSPMVPQVGEEYHGSRSRIVQP